MNNSFGNNCSPHAGMHTYMKEIFEDWSSKSSPSKLDNLLFSPQRIEVSMHQHNLQIELLSTNPIIKPKIRNTMFKISIFILHEISRHTPGYIYDHQYPNGSEWLIDWFYTYYQRYHTPSPIGISGECSLSFRAQAQVEHTVAPIMLPDMTGSWDLSIKGRI